jgi:hypothetical protein
MNDCGIDAPFIHQSDSHIGRSTAFYDVALQTLGMHRAMRMPENVGSDGIGYKFDYPVFRIDRFHPDRVRQHTAFAAKSRADVDAFRAAALKASGTDNGAPDQRDQTTMPRSYSTRMVTT